MQIKVSIADDHPMIIKGLQNMLATYNHIDLIATYLNGSLLLEGLTHQVPDVLLLDIQLPGKTGCITADRWWTVVRTHHCNQIPILPVAPSMNPTTRLAHTRPHASDLAWIFSP